MPQIKTNKGTVIKKENDIIEIVKETTIDDLKAEIDKLKEQITELQK